MAEATLTWTSGGAEIAVDLDITSSQGFERTAEVTEHAVEQGAPIADHVKPQSALITLECVISNSPIIVPSGQLQGATRAASSVTLATGERATVLAWSTPFDRVREVDALLDDLVQARELVSLTTAMRFAENLILTRYKGLRETGGGDSLGVTLELKAVRIVGTQRVAVPAVRRLQVPQTRGTQPTDDRSTLARLLDGNAATTEEQRAASRERARRIAAP